MEPLTNNQENFDPNQWSVPELLRHLYKQLNEMKNQIEAIRNDRSLYDRVYKNEMALLELRTQVEGEKEIYKSQLDRTKTWVAVIGVVIAIVSFLLK